MPVTRYFIPQILLNVRDFYFHKLGLDLRQSLGLLELLTPCDGMPELLASWEILINRSFTVHESLSRVDFSAAPG
jgi:hypothetical protein